MNKKKKQRLTIIVISVVTLAMISSVVLTQTAALRSNSKEQSKAQTQNKESKDNKKDANKKTPSVKPNPDKELRVLWAFADIDRDFMIQSKDPSDGDKSADYIFVKFSNEILDDKSKNSTTLVENYKLDGQPLPKGTVILPEIKGYDAEILKDKITIKLPNGYLKGVNAPHTLELSKEIKSKYGKNITGDLKLTLSYSKSESVVEKEDKNNTNKQIEGMPKYSVEIGKSLPYSTLVVVSLDTKTPEKYKVSVGGHVLPLKSKKTGEKVFIDVIEKDYAEDEAKNLIKIEEVK